MAKTRALSAHKTSELITDSLGYCCEKFFFDRYPNNELIAARLGVSERTVRRHREAAVRDEAYCKNYPKCALKSSSALRRLPE